MEPAQNTSLLLKSLYHTIQLGLGMGVLGLSFAINVIAGQTSGDWYFRLSNWFALATAVGLAEEGYRNLRRNVCPHCHTKVREKFQHILPNSEWGCHAGSQ